MNKKGAERLGKSVEETIGTTLREYFPKDVSENRRLMGLKVVKSGRPVSFEDHVGNTWYSNTIFPIRNHQGNITHLAIYGIDISDFKLKENALRESEARFRELADLLPQVVFEADAQGTLIYANRHAFNIFGYSEDDFEKGLNMLQMLSPDDRERAARNIQSILTGNPSSFKRHYRAMRKDGASFPAEIYSSPIERQGNILGLRGILVDMTEHNKTGVYCFGRGHTGPGHRPCPKAYRPATSSYNRCGDTRNERARVGPGFALDSPETQAAVYVRLHGQCHCSPWSPGRRRELYPKALLEEGPIH